MGRNTGWLLAPLLAASAGAVAKDGGVRVENAWRTRAVPAVATVTGG